MSAQDRRVSDILAILAAVSMFAAALEYLIPKPVPFFRIGLANIAILVVIRMLSFRHLLVLTMLKVLAQGLVNGTFASYVFVFSLCGSFSSLLLMRATALFGEDKVSLVGVSLVGAFASNVVQIALSVTFIFGSQAWLIAIPLLLSGIVSGVLVGIIAQRFSAVSAWLACMKTDYTAAVQRESG